MNSVTRAAATSAGRMVRPAVPKQQKRGIINFLTNYPDKVMATKKIQMAGGTRLAEKNPTWLKQGTGDLVSIGVGCALLGYGTISCISGHYKLATGKGKLN